MTASVASDPRDASLSPTEWIILLALAIYMRVSMAWLPFPSVDDFAYIPVALSALDPTYYTADFVFSDVPVHVKLWPALVWLLGPTTGLALGLYLISIPLTIATLHALTNISRAIRLPLSGMGLVLLLSVPLLERGLGRGAYGGLVASSFHMQWLCFVCLLYSYAYLVRGSPIKSGVALGFAALAHPIVAGHGGIAVALGILAQGRQGLRTLPKLGMAGFVASSPVSLTLIPGLLRGSSAAPDASSASVTTAELIDKAFLFRAPHHYELELGSIALMALAAVGGAAGLFLALGRDGSDVRTRTFGGVLAGHVVLLGAATFLHGGFAPTSWTHTSLLPYFLDLPRSTPLLLGLGAIGSVAGLAALTRFAEGDEKPRPWELAAGLVVVATAGATLFFNTAWQPWLAWMLMIPLLLELLRRRATPLSGTLEPALYAIPATGLAILHATHLQLDAPVEAHSQEMFDWIRAETPREALFIVPPGTREFRYYARRSLYVDFEMVPYANRSMLPEWRRRMEEITDPDEATLQAAGWVGIVEWDRRYDERAVPARVSRLLADTEANYFLTGVEHSPAPEADLPAGVTVAFDNERWRIYQRTP